MCLSQSSLFKPHLKHKHDVAIFPFQATPHCFPQVELAAAGDGNILPYFIVIKCSVPSGSNPYDFVSMRVIHNLHTEPAFNASAGWSLKKWEGSKTTRRKKNGQPVQQQEEFELVRWYLQHVDGHVITCQPKAWMDTGGFAMYIQTVLAPWWQKQQTSWTGLAQHDAMAAASGPSCVWTHQNSAACAPRAAIGSEFATMEAGARTYRR